MDNNKNNNDKAASLRECLEDSLQSAADLRRCGMSLEADAAENMARLARLQLDRLGAN